MPDTMPETKHPLYDRYPSEAMKGLFPQQQDYRTMCSSAMQDLCSDRNKFEGWRRMWVIGAEAEKELGLDISDDHISDFYRCEKDIDYERMKEIERQTKHDVMAGVREFAERLDREGHNTGGKVHLGFTSCEVTDNQEMMAMKSRMLLLRQETETLYDGVRNLGSIIALGNNYAPDENYTRRWLSGIVFICEEIRYRLGSFKARGAKGTTGTQESFMELFNRDQKKVKRLDDILTEKMGFDDKFMITGQTYPRIFDYQVTATLGIIAKMAETIVNDMEGGAYNYLLPKRNEFKDVKDACRDVYSYVAAMATMSSNQWLERTLDDSAQRRIVLTDAFCAADYIIGRLTAFITKSSKKNPSKGEGRRTSLLDGDEKKGLEMIAAKTADAITRMGGFALQHKDLACRGMTHYQTAQPTTIGKRIALWSYGFALALEDIEHAIGASAPKAMDRAIAEYKMATTLALPVIAAAKTASDIRLLQHDYEVSEPFAQGQVGSSAMPHKRNPMKSERICSLANVSNNYLTTQLSGYNWLCTDSVMELVLSIFVGDTEKQRGFTVNPVVVKSNLMREFPFLCAEPVLMEEVKKGGDRQELHHKVQQCALEAWDNVLNGGENNMLKLLTMGGFIVPLHKKQDILNPMNYVGRAPEQTAEYCEGIVKPIAKRYKGRLGRESEVKV